MIKHRKIAGLSPIWAPFNGWSVIFTPFGFPDSLRPLLDVFDQGRQTQWLNKHLLCSLPPETYHITFADLINDGNIKRVSTARREPCKRALEQLEMPEVLAEAIREAVAPPYCPEITFCFDHLAAPTGRMLAVFLKPQHHDEKYQLLLDKRQRIQKVLLNHYGLRLRQLVPHLTLGYFVNRKAGKMAQPAISRFERKLRRAFGDHSISASGLGLYAFRNMIDYTRIDDFG